MKNERKMTKVEEFMWNVTLKRKTILDEITRK